MRTDKIFISLIICLIAIVATSCSDNDKSSTSSVKQEVKEYSIGVIMPTQYRERWERTAKWALENINKSQSSLSKAVRFSIHDVTEDGISPDEMEATVKRMIEEDGDSAIIGPMGIANAYGAARACTASRCHVYGSARHMWTSQATLPSSMRSATRMRCS